MTICRFLSLLALGIGLSGPAAAQTERILLVGDSWVQQAWSAGAFETALLNKGLGQFVERGGPTTIGGSTAASWTAPSRLALITQELQSGPDLDIVHLSIGGNDFLQNPPSNPAEAAALLAQITDDTRTVAQHILAVRPDARIGYAVYDYIPAAVLSTELALMALNIHGLHFEMPNFFLVNNLGLLHHAFGFPGVFGPGATPRPGGYPNYAPVLGGDPALPGATAHFADSIHPTTTSYVRLAEHAIEEFYGEWLEPTAGLDIKPGVDPNPIQVNQAGASIVVAILGDAFFDVADVDTSSIAFGPGAAAPVDPAGILLDADGDGFTDLLHSYTIGASGITLTDTEACVAFDNVHGVAFGGCDGVQPVAGSGCGGGFQTAWVLVPGLVLRRRCRRRR